MDRLEAMFVLQTVVSEGSLSAAGRKLGMPLATVSRKISELETHLNARLLHRSTRQLQLTDAGHEYVIACKRILEEVHEAERAVSGEYTAPRGDLIITAPIVFGRLHVLPIVIAFLRTYPEVNVRLLLGDRTASLLEDRIDLALRIGELGDSSLSATRVGKTRRVVCGHPDYFKEHGMPSVPDDLGFHQCISFDAMTSAETWPFKINKGEVTVPIGTRISVNTAEAAIDAACAGFGTTRVLSYQIVKPLKAGLLSIALPEYELSPMPVHLVYSRQGRLPVKLRAFLDYAQPILREILHDPDV